MIQVFFRHRGQTGLVEISASTHERLRNYRSPRALLLSQVIKQVRHRYQEVSEQNILLYLDSEAPQR